jgi:hypothetical protein
MEVIRLQEDWQVLVAIRRQSRETKLKTFEGPAGRIVELLHLQPTPWVDVISGAIELHQEKVDRTEVT